MGEMEIAEKCWIDYDGLASLGRAFEAILSQGIIRGDEQ